MMRQTGGCEVGATSTRSSSDSSAFASASRTAITPSCSPSAPITRISRARIRSFTRGSRSMLLTPPQRTKKEWPTATPQQSRRSSSVTGPGSSPAGEKRMASTLIYHNDPEYSTGRLRASTRARSSPAGLPTEVAHSGRSGIRSQARWPPSCGQGGPPRRGAWIKLVLPVLREYPVADVVRVSGPSAAVIKRTRVGGKPSPELTTTLIRIAGEFARRKLEAWNQTAPSNDLAACFAYLNYRARLRRILTRRSMRDAPRP